MSITAFFLAFLLTGSPFASAQGETGESWEARITAVEGEVVVFPRGSEEGIFAEVDTPLESGDRVETGANSRVEIALEADSVMDLGPDSVLDVESMSVERSVFELSLGSLVAKIKSLVSRRGGLSIRTPTAVAAVRGTEFGVEVEASGASQIGVFDEGRVSVLPVAEGSEEAVLSAQDETRVEKGSRRARIGKLKRFLAHHSRMKRLRGRRAELRKRWKAMPPEAREKMRSEWKARFSQKLERLSPAKRKALLEGLKRKSRQARRAAGRKAIQKKIRQKFKNGGRPQRPRPGRRDGGRRRGAPKKP